MAGMKVDIWKEYDVLNIEDLNHAFLESGEKYFRIYGQDRACYFDLGYTKATDTLFAYDMVVNDKTKTHYMGNLIIVLMKFMNEKKLSYDHVPVCTEVEPQMKPFREQMYQMFPNVKRLNFS